MEEPAQIDLSAGKPTNENELNKFTNLCSELEFALANSFTALDDVLALKDIILEQNLPSVVKVKLTLAVGRLHRSMSDLSVPTGEVARLVRLYAVPWENKSKALKKLHQDYESKQHKLEIALRRLEMVGVQTMRMEKERRIMNWEKMFAKLVGGKGHGQRWRFFIHQFKQKLKRGEDVSSFYSTISNEDSDSDADEKGDEDNVSPKRNTLFAQELKEKLKKFDGLGQEFPSNKQTSDGMEEGKYDRNSTAGEESEASIVLGTSDDNTSTVEPDTPISIGGTKKKVRFDDYEDAPRVPEQNEGDWKKHLVQEVTKEMEEKSCWTHEPDYETFFHMRLYAPKCKTLTSSWCTVAFDNEVRRSEVFKNSKKVEVEADEKEPRRDKAGKLSSEVDEVGKKSGNAEGEASEEYQEFSFKLSKGFEKQNKEDFTLKFSVHPANKKKMIAMTTVKLSDVAKIDEELLERNLKEINGRPTSYPIKSTVNNAELVFNRPCGEIRLLCFYSRVYLPLVISRGTETLSIEELTNRIIELQKKEALKRLKSAGTSMSEHPIYTEEQMNSAKEELKQQLRSLKDEYEERLSLMISRLSRENVEGLREFVNAATSPLFAWAESDNKDNQAQILSPVREPSPNKGRYIERVKRSRENSPKKSAAQRLEKKQQTTGQHLFKDFNERMETFKEESLKHREQLRDKVKDEVGREMERTLASSNKLDTSTTRNGKISEEVCLPALYMPTKTRNLYTPKARSYFHAFGTYKDRLTQPPSILELPRLGADNADIVGIYETVMRQKMESKSPDLENDTDLGRFSLESSSSIEIPDIETGENDDPAKNGNSNGSKMSNHSST